MRIMESDGAVEYVIPSDPEEAHRIRDLIEKQLRTNHFEDKEIFGIKLALDEALVNAIKHGNQMDHAKRVFIRVRIRPDRFDINITDEGPGFNPDDVPDPLADENLERPCGRGLLLMRSYMTEVTYHPPGNHLTMSKIRKAVANGCR